jgi:hypothetical protein
VSRQHLYTGKSGQLAVMAELVSRGYNVAVPEVDAGDDIFVRNVSTSLRQWLGEFYVAFEPARSRSVSWMLGGGCSVTAAWWRWPGGDGLVGTAWWGRLGGGGLVVAAW